MADPAIMSPETAAAVAAAVEAAELAGILPEGGIYGPVVMPAAGNGRCCTGAAAKGPQYCTCWTWVYDLEQQPATPALPVTRGSMCGDCAYRPGSPERQGDPRYKGGQALLDKIVQTGEPFFCHQGMRRLVRFTHPSGAVVDVAPQGAGAYDPPIEGDVAYKADGTPGDLCGGWSALHAWHQHLRRKEESGE